MRLTVLLLVLLVPSVAFAQGVDCPGCVMGVFDDSGLSRNFGFWDSSTDPLKTVWVGILYDPSADINGLTSIEFSVDGTAGFCSFGYPCFRGIIDPVITIGTTTAAPDDKENGQGGVTMAWNQCLEGNRALVRIDLLRLDAIPNDLVLRVTHKFPPSNPVYASPMFTRCDGPIFTPTTVTGGCYVINPTVGPGETVGDCTLMETSSVESTAWSMIKLLYR